MRFYRQKLLDPRWQKKRLAVLERDNWTCQFCLSRTQTLDVHHCRYRRGVEPWDYPLADLLTLCRDCHQAETEHNNAPHLRAAGIVRELRKVGPRQNALLVASGRLDPPERRQVMPIKPFVAPAPTSQPDRQKAASGYYAATREGMKKITMGISLENHRRLKIFSIGNGGLEKTMMEALEDFFLKHGI